MLDQATKKLEEEYYGEQAIVTHSEDGSFDVYLNDLRIESEKEFISEHRQVISEMLCVWRNGDIDLPSIHIRRELVKGNPGDLNTIIYLRGDEGISSVFLKDTIQMIRLD